MEGTYGWKITTKTRWTLLGRKTVSRIEGTPCWEALEDWVHGGDIHAPSIDWLRLAAMDAVNELKRRNDGNRGW